VIACIISDEEIGKLLYEQSWVFLSPKRFTEYRAKERKE